MSDTEVRREGEDGTTSDADEVGSEVAPAGDAGPAPSEVPPAGDAGQAPSETEPPTDVEQARREVEQTRAEMGDTVEALSQKADVKAQFRQRMEERKAVLRGRQDELRAKAAEARERMSGATPEDAKGAASRVAQTAEEKPLPAIGVAFGAGLLLGWLIARP
jgi:ElaB/YqjD/DUF883 family membrane-anchored ribosome-binding protein